MAKVDKATYDNAMQAGETGFVLTISSPSLQGGEHVQHFTAPDIEVEIRRLTAHLVNAVGANNLTDKDQNQRLVKEWMGVIHRG